MSIPIWHPPGPPPPGLNLLLSSVSYLLALPVDYYVEVDMAGLAAIIDALGGVTVDVGPVPLPIGGVTYDGRHVTPDGYVPAGVQHLDGNQALWFARSRRNSDDYDRMARQRCLMTPYSRRSDPSTWSPTSSRSPKPPQTASPPTSPDPAARAADTGRRAPAAAPAGHLLRPEPARPRRPVRQVQPGQTGSPYMRRLVGAATVGVAATVPPPVAGSGTPATAPAPAGAPPGITSVAPSCTGP